MLFLYALSQCQIIAIAVMHSHNIGFNEAAMMRNCKRKSAVTIIFLQCIASATIRLIRF